MHTALPCACSRVTHTLPLSYTGRTSVYRTTHQSSPMLGPGRAYEVRAGRGRAGPSRINQLVGERSVQAPRGVPVGADRTHVDAG
eukprot:3063840-Prymnesium_polylepis.2